MRTENKNFGAEEARWMPAHADVLAQAEEIAGGLIEQHLRSDRKKARRARRMRSNGADLEVDGLQHGVERYVLN